MQNIRLVISQNDISKFLRLWMKDYPDITMKIRNVSLWKLRSLVYKADTVRVEWITNFGADLISESRRQLCFEKPEAAGTSWEMRAGYQCASLTHHLPFIWIKGSLSLEKKMSEKTNCNCYFLPGKLIINFLFIYSNINSYDRGRSKVSF